MLMYSQSLLVCVDTARDNTDESKKRRHCLLGLSFTLGMTIENMATVVGLWGFVRVGEVVFYSY